MLRRAKRSRAKLRHFITSLLLCATPYFNLGSCSGSSHNDLSLGTLDLPSTGNYNFLATLPANR